MERHFRDQYPDLVDLIPDLVEQYRANPVGSLATVRCHPWQFDGRVALIGDCAHAVVPFMVRAPTAPSRMSSVPGSLPHGTFRRLGPRAPAYEAGRRTTPTPLPIWPWPISPDARDKVDDPVFKTGKRVEHALEKALPGALRVPL